MKTRTCLLLLPLLVLGSGLTTAQAATAPKKVCKIVVDPAGDAGVSPLTTGPKAPGSQNEDLLSADLSSDGKTLTGVLRTAALTVPDPMAPLGQGFYIEFAAKGVENVLFLAARTYPQGTTFVYGYSAADPTSGLTTSYTIGTAKGVVDTAKKEVRISAPNAGFAKAGTKLPKGLKLSSVAVKTQRILGQSVVPSQSVGGTRVPVGGLLLTVDDGTGSNYVVGTPSCVKPGA